MIVRVVVTLATAFLVLAPAAISSGYVLLTV